MIVFFKDLDLDNLAIIDAEYNEGEIIQFAGLMFKRIGDSLYQVSKSENIYIKLPYNKQVNSFIRRFTGITNQFLREEGQDLEDAIEEINEFFYVEGSLGIVAHDMSNDVDFLHDNGIYIEDIADELICTYKLSQKIYKQGQKLNLKALALEAGFKHDNTHNAIDDVWATTAVFSLLKKLEQELEDDEFFES